MPSSPEQHYTNFKFIYENNIWGNNEDKNYKGSSGPGSQLKDALPYVCFLRGWLKGKEIKSVVDVGCGDLRHFYPLYHETDIDYTGFDIYEDIIEAHHKVPQYNNPKWKFHIMNCYAQRAELPCADMLILKDVLQHWTDEEVKIFLDFATRTEKYKHILIVNCVGNPEGTLDTPGRWRGLDEKHFLLKPYNLFPIFTYNTKRCLLWSAAKG